MAVDIYQLIKKSVSIGINIFITLSGLKYNSDTFSNHLDNYVISLRGFVE